MAIIKCKMCGGDLVLIPDSTIAECEYCGTTQTVPSADNEKKLIQFERAERLRKNCEFDKAAGVYESIVSEFRQEAEAYWGLVLCKFGIEYVDDPATGKKIPTCHRSSFESIMEDPDLEQTLENADVVSRKVYREEAKQIEEIRKAIVEVSSKEEPYDIFICYKETDVNGERTIDSVIAQDMYTSLTNEGYKVFFARITLEDKLGQEYEPYIFAALNSAKVMLAVGTDYEYYNAVWVKNEWSRFLKLIEAGQKKTLIPCYKNIDAYDMPKEFAKLQAQDMGKVGAMQDLLRGIGKILEDKKAAPAKASIQSTDLNNSFVYNTALEKGNSKKIPVVKEGIKALESIAGWQDADSQRLVLEEKLKKLKKKKNIKNGIIAFVIFAIAGGIFAKVKIDEHNYKKECYEIALGYLEDGAYDSALNYFKRAEGYEDASMYVNDSDLIAKAEAMSATVEEAFSASTSKVLVPSDFIVNAEDLMVNATRLAAGEVAFNLEMVNNSEMEWVYYTSDGVKYAGTAHLSDNGETYMFVTEDGREFKGVYKDNQIIVTEGPDEFCGTYLDPMAIAEYMIQKMQSSINDESFYENFEIAMMLVSSIDYEGYATKYLDEQFVMLEEARY